MKHALVKLTLVVYIWSVAATATGLDPEAAHKRWSAEVRNRLSLAMQSHGYDARVRQTELGKMIGMDQSGVSATLRGIQDFPLEASLLAAKYLGVDWEYLAAVDVLRDLMASGLRLEQVSPAQKNFYDTFRFVVSGYLPSRDDRIRREKELLHRDLMQKMKEINSEWELKVSERFNALIIGRAPNPRRPNFRGLAQEAGVEETLLSELRYARATMPLNFARFLANRYRVSIKWLLAVETLKPLKDVDPTEYPDRFQNMRDAVQFAWPRPSLTDCAPRLASGSDVQSDEEGGADL